MEKQVDTHDTEAQGPNGNTSNKGIRARIWQWTLNNYSGEDEIHLKEFAEKNCVYSVWQPEMSSTGTPHLQGMFEFKNPRYFTALKKEFPRMHLEVAKKPEALKKYCKKEETRIGDTVEIGEIRELSAEDAGWLYILKQLEKKRALSSKIDAYTEKIYDRVYVEMMARQYERDLSNAEIAPAPIEKE